MDAVWTLKRRAVLWRAGQRLATGDGRLIPLSLGWWAVISAVTARRADSISDVRVSHLLARVPLPSRPLLSSHPIPCILSPPLLLLTFFLLPCFVPSPFYPVVSVVYADLLHCFALSLSFTALRPMFVAPRQPFFQHFCVAFILEPNF